jgi:hypothetical protein
MVEPAFAGNRLLNIIIFWSRSGCTSRRSHFSKTIFMNRVREARNHFQKEVDVSQPTKGIQHYFWIASLCSQLGPSGLPGSAQSAQPLTAVCCRESTCFVHDAEKSLMDALT